MAACGCWAFPQRVGLGWHLHRDYAVGQIGSAITMPVLLTSQEKARIATRKYAAANPEKARARSRKWNLTNPEGVQLKNNRRRARRMENGVFLVSPKEIKQLKSRPCYLCGESKSTTVDHIIPLVRGGRHSIGNLLGACGPCNSSKHDKYLVEYRRYKTDSVR